MRNYIVDRLDGYFKGGYTLNRVPLLIGPSGIAKSALIKEAADKNGMRVVDIRTAFMSRLDIEGLSEKIEIDGKFYSEASPMMALIKCTDEYLRVAREACKILEEEIKNSDAEHKKLFGETLKKLQYEAKTPVLLFDEVTRGEGSVRQVLTKIFTDKAFMGYSMKEARVVAATNDQLDATGNSIEIYSVNDAYDVAFYDRFESIYVDAKTMNSYWLKWAENNLHKSIYKQAKESPYDEKHFLGDVDIKEALVSPYPCYRTWELASNYVKRTKTPISDFVNSMVGGSNKLSMTEFIREAITTNTPALVISSSGMGKTARINKFCKDNGYQMIDINLSEVDRLDLEGMPVKQNTLKAMFEGYRINKNIADKLQKIVSESSLPTNVTVRAPKKEYVDAFKKALDSGNKVVIYFDECNRVQNVSVMSAIFQVISDNRLFGIDFNPENVTCILSCNMDENCSDAQELDPALCARFAIWKQNSYTNTEATSFITYAKENNFNSAICAFLVNQGSKVKDILGSVNTRTMSISAASSRGWEDLSRTLNASDNDLLTGNLLITSSDELDCISQYLRYGVTSSSLSISGIIDNMKKRIGNWAVMGLDDSYECLGQVRTPAEIKKRLTEELATNDFKDAGFCKEFLKTVLAVETPVWDYRRDFFRIFLGDWANEFTSFYNKYVIVESNSIENVIILNDYKKSQEEIIKALGKGVAVAYSVLNDIPGKFTNKEEGTRLARYTWGLIASTYNQSERNEILKHLTGSTLELFNDRDYYTKHMLKDAKVGNVLHCVRV